MGTTQIEIHNNVLTSQQKHYGKNVLPSPRALEDVPVAPFSLLKFGIPQRIDQKLGASKTQSWRKEVIGPILHRHSESNSKKIASKTSQTNKPISNNILQPRNLAKKTISETQRQRLVDGNLLPAPGLTTGEEFHTEDLLDALFLPRQFRLKDGSLYSQHVSPAPATRLDVLSLHDTLVQQLERRRAKEVGLCPIRESLYSDCFNEIIRHVAVGCGERGRLLFHVKEEFDREKEAWKKLHESVTKFKLRKALHEECRKAKEQEKIEALESEIAELEDKKKALQEQYEDLHTKEQIAKSEENAAHEKRLAVLKSSANTIQERIELFLIVQNTSYLPQQATHRKSTNQE